MSTLVKRGELMPDTCLHFDTVTYFACEGDVFEWCRDCGADVYDGLDAARGVRNGVALSLLLWAVLLGAAIGSMTWWGVISA